MPSNLKLGYRTRRPRKTTEIQNMLRAVPEVKALWFICGSDGRVKEKRNTNIRVASQN